MVSKTRFRDSNGVTVAEWETSAKRRCEFESAKAARARIAERDWSLEVGCERSRGPACRGNSN